MLVLVTGARTWVDEETMRQVLVRAPLLVEDDGGRAMALMHGDSPGGGADRMAGRLAQEWGWLVLPRPAQGRTAEHFFARNRAMVHEAVGLRTRYGTTVLVMAFVMDCARPDCSSGKPHLTHGTAHTMAYAERQGLAVITVRPGEVLKA